MRITFASAPPWHGGEGLAGRELVVLAVMETRRGMCYFVPYDPWPLWMGGDTENVFVSSPIIPMEWTSRMWLAEGRVEEAGHAAQIVADASDKAEARLGRGVLLKVYFEVAHLVERAGGKVCALADVVELVSGVVDDVMLVRHVVALAVGNVCRWFGVAIGGFDKEFLLWECLAD